MKDFIDKVIRWMCQGNNHIGHFVAGFLAAFLTIGGSIATAIAFECKDVQYNNFNWDAWDWTDFGATIVGGIVGTAVVIGLCFLIRSWII